MAILTDIDLVLLKRKWKRKELIIFLKLNHPLEYSHPFIFSMVVYWFDSNRENYWQLKSCPFHILIFITTWKGEYSNIFPDLGFKILTTIRKIKLLYTYIRIKMKNLNLHMECSIPMFSKTWAGRSVYNQISDCKLEVSTQEV